MRGSRVVVGEEANLLANDTPGLLLQKHVAKLPAGDAGIHFTVDEIGVCRQGGQTVNLGKVEFNAKAFESRAWKHGDGQRP